MVQFRKFNYGREAHKGLKLPKRFTNASPWGQCQIHVRCGKCGNPYQVWPLSTTITSRLRFVNLFVEGTKVCGSRRDRGSSTTAVRPDMAAAASTGYRGRLRSSRRDRGSDEKYSDINGRLSRKTGRPGHCHYIQVKSIQNLNFLFEYVFWNLKNFTFWIVYLQLLLVLKANVSQENRVFCFKTQGI